MSVYSVLFTLSAPSLNSLLQSALFRQEQIALLSLLQASKLEAISSDFDNDITVVDHALYSRLYTYTPSNDIHLSLNRSYLRFKPKGTSNSGSLSILSKNRSGKISCGIGLAKLSLK